MANFISLEAAVKEFYVQQSYYDAEWGAKRFTTEDVQDILQSIPAADVRPVVRGEWIPFTSEAAGDIWYCSACDVGFAHRTDFCPHCGADMRGGDAE